MIHTALASVTFRHLSIKEIIELVKKAGLDGIEWGGDIHVPHGNLKTAKLVNKMTRDAGLEIVSYGSYYRVGVSEQKGIKFRDVLETAKLLDTSNIRVWAGNKSAKFIIPEERNRIVKESRRIAEMSKSYGIKISFEYHDHTLTDSAGSTRQFLEEIKHEDVRTYWQPYVDKSLDFNVRSIKELLDYISNFHVFYWYPDKNSRLLLEEGRKHWRNYLKILKKVNSKNYAILEFVKDNTMVNFIRDAALLKSLLKDLYS